MNLMLILQTSLVLMMMSSSDDEIHVMNQDLEFQEHPNWSI